MPTARCESCKSSFETEEATAVCPLCGKAAEVDLTIRVHCSCGTILKAPPRMRGRVIACPRCTRPVPIPRGDEEEEEKGTVQVGRKTRYIFFLALLPIFVATQGEKDDPRKRVDRTLANFKIDGSSAATLSEKVRLIPNKRAEKAALPAGSPMPWVYAAAGFALIFAFLWLSFGTPTLGTGEMILGVAVMAGAGIALGFLVNILFPQPAEAESLPRLFLASLVGGVAAELVKGGWLTIRRGKLPRRGLVLLGLAVGAGYGFGFGTQEGSDMSGVALGRAYWMEALSLIALQAVWGGITALFLTHGRGVTAARLFTASSASIGLHAVFYIVHRQELYLGSIIVGIGSFALFHALQYWREETEQEVVAGETIRV